MYWSLYSFCGLFILNLTLGLFYFPILGIDSVLLDFSFLFCLVTSKICILCGLVSCGFYVLVHSSGVCCIQMIPAFLCVHFWRRWCSGAEVMALTSWSSIKTPHVMAVIWSPMVRTSCCSYVLDLTVQACKFWLSVLRQHESSGRTSFCRRFLVVFHQVFVAKLWWRHKPKVILLSTSSVRYNNQSLTPKTQVSVDTPFILTSG